MREEGTDVGECVGEVLTANGGEVGDIVGELDEIEERELTTAFEV